MKPQQSAEPTLERVLRPAQGGDLSTSKPIEIGGRPTTTNVQPATRQIPFSAPASRLIAPKAPLTRPRLTPRDPPIFDLPPSLPSTTIISSEEEDLSICVKGGEVEPQGREIQGALRVPSTESKRDDPNKPWGIARSLTNNVFHPAASCPNGKGLDANMMGRSPTIFGILSGTEGTTQNGPATVNSMGSSNTQVSSRNPAFRGGPPAVGSGRPLGLGAQPEEEEEEDEDDDVEIENRPEIPVEEELQFDITLDSN